MKNEMVLNGFSEVLEMDLLEVDGGGVASAVSGAVVGAALGGLYVACEATVRSVSGRETRTSAEVGRAVLNSMLSGAVTGAITGAWSPLP